MTYIVIGFLMQCIFTMDEYIIENKVKSGLISSDLLKPISFRLYIFSHNLGNTAFKLVMQLIPVLIVSILLFKLLAPFSLAMGIYFVISAVLGFLVLYCLNFIVWVSSFWFFWTFSLVTIKDAFVMIFSGALLPLRFMPQWLQDFIKFTPFDSIYFTPISIYLGQVPSEDIFMTIVRQVIWLGILFVIGGYTTHMGLAELYFKGDKMTSLKWSVKTSKDKSLADKEVEKVAEKYHEFAIESTKEVVVRLR